MSKFLEYNNIQSSLSELNCHVSPAEAHGIICGMLTVNTAADQNTWLNEIIEDDQLNNTAVTQLNTLFKQSLQQLNDSNLGLKILLPADDTTLAIRLATIQEWCQGLLYGTALSGLKEWTKLPEDSREFLQDVSQISSSGDFDLEEDEEAEQHYSEIVEYLRVGTLLLSEELQPSKLDTAVH